MRREGRTRVDYTPGQGAQAALDAAAARWPDLNQQALIDLLVINGQSAMFFHAWAPPALPRGSRERWRADLSGSPCSGTSASGSQHRVPKDPELDAVGNVFLNIALNALKEDHHAPLNAAPGDQ